MTLTLKANAEVYKAHGVTGFYEEHLSETDIASMLLVDCGFLFFVIYMELVGRLLGTRISN